MRTRTLEVTCDICHDTVIWRRGGQYAPPKTGEKETEKETEPGIMWPGIEAWTLDPAANHDVCPTCAATLAPVVKP